MSQIQKWYSLKEVWTLFFNVNERSVVKLHQRFHWL